MAYGQAVQVGHVMNVSTVDRQSGSLKTIETLEIFNLSLISLPFHFGVLRSASVFVFYVAWQAGFKNDTRITRALGWQSARVSQSAKSRIFESRKSMGLHFCRGSELVVPLFDTSRKCLGPEFKIFKGTFGKQVCQCCGMKMHEIAKVPSSASTNRKAGKCATSEYQQPSKDLDFSSCVSMAQAPSLVRRT